MHMQMTYKNHSKLKAIVVKTLIALHSFTVEVAFWPTAKRERWKHPNGSIMDDKLTITVYVYKYKYKYNYLKRGGKLCQWDDQLLCICRHRPLLDHHRNCDDNQKCILLPSQLSPEIFKFLIERTPHWLNLF